MKRNVNAGICTLVFVLATFAPQYGRAQQKKITTANIPFEFVIGGTKLPSGEYIIDSIAPGIFLFRNKSAKNVEEQVTTLPLATPPQDSPAKLIFVRRDDAYFLSEICINNNRRILTNNYGLQAETGSRGKEHRDVLLNER